MAADSECSERQPIPMGWGPLVSQSPRDRIRADVIRECVTWLAMHHADFKPEFLAGEMARDMLGVE